MPFNRFYHASCPPKWFCVVKKIQFELFFYRCCKLFWKKNVSEIFVCQQISHVAHQNHLARTEIVYLSQLGATRSLTVPMPPMKKTAVSAPALHRLQNENVDTTTTWADPISLVTFSSFGSEWVLHLWHCLDYQWHCDKAVIVALCFVCRPHRMLPLLQAGGERKRFHQLQLHLTVHPPVMDLRWCKWLRWLCRWDQLPGWAAI